MAQARHRRDHDQLDDTALTMHAHAGIDSIDPWRLIAAFRAVLELRQPLAPTKVVEHTKSALGLSFSEREELRRRATVKSMSTPENVRARIILLADDGVPNAVIANRLGVSRNTVIHWRARFQRRGLAGLDPLPKSGRPRTADRAPRALMASLSSSAVTTAAALRDAKRQLNRADPHRKPRPASANLAALAKLLPPGRPPCFDSQQVWDDYIQHAAVSGRRAHSDGPVIWLARDKPALNRAFDFCEDCTQARQARMQGLNRCLPGFLKGTDA